MRSIPARKGLTISEKTRQPDPLRLVQGSDISQTWKYFKEAFTDYALVEDLFQETPNKQVVIFRACFGDSNRQLLRSLNLGEILRDDKANSTTPCKTMKNIIDTLDQKFAPHENVYFRRHLFSRIRQSDNEPVADFVDRVLKAVRLCKFTTESELIINQRIGGTSLEAARRIIF